MKNPKYLIACVLFALVAAAAAFQNQNQGFAAGYVVEEFRGRAPTNFGFGTPKMDDDIEDALEAIARFEKKHKAQMKNFNYKQMMEERQKLRAKLIQAHNSRFQKNNEELAKKYGKTGKMYGRRLRNPYTIHKKDIKMEGKKYFPKEETSTKKQFHRHSKPLIRRMPKRLEQGTQLGTMGKGTIQIGGEKTEGFGQEYKKGGDFEKGFNGKKYGKRYGGRFGKRFGGRFGKRYGKKYGKRFGKRFGRRFGRGKFGRRFGKRFGRGKFGGRFGKRLGRGKLRIIIATGKNHYGLINHLHKKHIFNRKYQYNADNFLLTFITANPWYIKSYYYVQAREKCQRLCDRRFLRRMRRCRHKKCSMRFLKRAQKCEARCEKILAF